METLPKVAHVECDLHQKFTIAAARDAQNRLVWRKRLEHANRPQLRAQLGTWPAAARWLLGVRPAAWPSRTVWMRT